MPGLDPPHADNEKVYMFTILVQGVNMWLELGELGLLHGHRRLESRQRANRLGCWLETSMLMASMLEWRLTASRLDAATRSLKLTAS